VGLEGMSIVQVWGSELGRRTVICDTTHTENWCLFDDNLTYLMNTPFLLVSALNMLGFCA
jgi:hypothetical protein